MKLIDNGWLELDLSNTGESPGVGGFRGYWSGVWCCNWMLSWRLDEDWFQLACPQWVWNLLQMVGGDHI